jgi:hypothetical protein
MFSYLAKLLGKQETIRYAGSRRRQAFPRCRPTLEALENRLVPSVTPQAIAAINADYAANPFLGTAVTKYLDTPDHVGAYRDYQNGSIYYSPYSGAHEVHGAIKAKWLSAGGVAFGYPTTDETTTPDGVGRYNHFELQVGSGYTKVTYLSAIDWTKQYGAHEINGNFAAKFFKLGAENFGEAITDATPTPDGVGLYMHFEKQQSWGMDQYAIDYTQQYGAHEVDGLIARKFFSLGAENFGEAITDETPTPDGVGLYNHFEKQQSWGMDQYAIDYTQQYGAHEVDGLIARKFFSLGAENFGEAITDETQTGDGAGLYNHFEKQQSWGMDQYAIDFTKTYGAHEVDGLIAQKFFNLGAESFAEAITDETWANSVAYNHFENWYAGGPNLFAIDWTLQYGAHVVGTGLYGQDIYHHWMDIQHGEQGIMGGAISDPAAGNSNIGTMQLFQHGEIQDDSWVLQDVFAHNGNQITFEWSFHSTSYDGFLVLWGLNGNAAGETQTNVDYWNGSYGQYTVTNLSPGSTYTFSVDPYTSNGIWGNNYGGWSNAIIYML